MNNAVKGARGSVVHRGIRPARSTEDFPDPEAPQLPSRHIWAEVFGLWRPHPGRAGFDDFYQGTRQRLVAYLFAVGVDLAEAQDAAQEAYTRAWQRWSGLAGSADPQAWVRTVGGEPHPKKDATLTNFHRFVAESARFPMFTSLLNHPISDGALVLARLRCTVPLPASLE